MSIFSGIFQVLAKAGGAVSFVVGIGKQMLPFIRAARELSPDIDRIIDGIEAQVTTGGTVADDWFDERMDAILALDGFFGELAEVATAGKAVTSMVETIACYETPDIVTPAETEMLVARLAVLRAALAALGTKNDIEAALAKI